MAENGADAAVYHEPSITIILKQAGFLLALNIVNSCLDRLLYCGLIGQLFVGILWGTPGAKWLSRETETVIQQLGFLGLIMLVYQGGLSTSPKSFKANLLMALAVAITGIAAPIGLSFILTKLVSASPLQAFAAGAALSSTSLGTTFTILSTTRLSTTRLGTLTSSAAMLDDVVGLVMVQVISNLSQSAGSFDPVTVIRPIFVSIGFAVGLFVICAFCFEPILKKISRSKIKVPDFMVITQFAFLAQTCLLIGMVAGATYAGTSNLFAAYLAGLMVSWFDGLIAESKAQIFSSARHPGTTISETDTPHERVTATRDGNDAGHNSEETPVASQNDLPTGEIVYDRYFEKPVDRILIPMFFASIGFAIPITEMFKGNIVWRGVVYGILMAVGKLITGLWLVRFSGNPVSTLISLIKDLRTQNDNSSQKTEKTTRGKRCQHQNQAERHVTRSKTAAVAGEQSRHTGNSVSGTSNDSNSQATPMAGTTLPPKPKSLYPSSILGLAMVARGEIGYLIASLAESQGIFSNGQSAEPSETYLVVIWAISICTLIGPIAVGGLVKRVRKLQQAKESQDSPDPLGAWGI